jgi:hypothetical protein
LFFVTISKILLHSVCKACNLQIRFDCFSTYLFIVADVSSLSPNYAKKLCFVVKSCCNFKAQKIVFLYSE